MRRVVTLLVVSIATARGAGASPQACREAILLATARHDQTTAKVIGFCQQRHIADCDGDARAAAKIARAAGKLQSSITLRCCGPDRICGTAGDDALDALGWGAGFCPNLDRGDCNALISSPGDIGPCLACIGHTAANDLVTLTAVSASSGSDALARCANVIAKESSGLVARTSKALLACWKAREAGRHTNPCPAPGDGKAAGAIAAAVARTQASICKTCGGPDRACGGVDDLAPAVLGYPATCPAVTDPDGSACGGAISTLSDLVDCVTCVAGHLAECTDHAAVPAFLAYPPECAAPGYQVRKPVPTSKDPTDAANAAALVKVLTALGGTATGTKHNDVHFATPLAAQACTGFAAIEVPLRKGQATQKTLRGCGELGTCQDNDRLKLRCLPAS